MASPVFVTGGAGFIGSAVVRKPIAATSSRVVTVDRLTYAGNLARHGTHDSLHRASSFVETLEKRQELKVSCHEEIAWRMGYIDREALRRNAEGLLKSGYGEYLLELLRRERAR